MNNETKAELRRIIKERDQEIRKLKIRFDTLKYNHDYLKYNKEPGFMEDIVLILLILIAPFIIMLMNE